ncbi:MAG: TraB/GumN family protein [Ignavibacteriaceae bacterium]
MKYFKSKAIILLWILIILLDQNTNQAQSSIPDHTLLWRISGNGLKTNSYLFGTIHIKDKRVFNLNDSIVYAIQSCDVFAGELNMDSINTDLLKSLSTTNYKRVTLKEILDDKEIILLEKKSEKLLGKSLKDFNNLDARLVLFEFENDNYPKDMPYALDVFLYKIAKANNNTIGALEKLEDQMKLFTDIDTETMTKLFKSLINDTTNIDSMYEHLVDSYLSSNLDKMDKIFGQWSKEYQTFSDKLLKDRNYLMSDNIELMVKQHPTFFAVGSGHLIGLEGLIQLLRNKGFNVDPVFCNEYDLVKNYSLEKIEASWATYTPNDGGFIIKMPGEAIPHPNMQQIPGVKIESGIYADVMKDVFYAALKFIYPTKFDSVKIDSMFNAVKYNLETNGYQFNDDGKNIIVDNINGKEFIAQAQGYQITLKLFIRDKHFYMLQSIYEKESLTSRLEADKFFRSFHITPYTEVYVNKTWDYFVDDSCKFKIKFPGKPLKQSFNNIESENISKIFTAVEDSVENFYMLIFLQSNNSSFGINDKYYMKQIIQTYSNSVDNNIDIKPEVIVDDYSYVDFRISDNKYQHFGKLIIHANNIYYLLSSYDYTKTDSLKSIEYLSSFEVLPIINISWYNYLDSLNNYTINIPGKEFSKIDTLYDGSLLFEVYDKVNGLSYKLSKETFSDYYKADSTFFNSQLSYHDYKDLIVISDTSYTSNQLFTNEVIFRESDDYNFTKLKQILNGNVLYKLSVTAPTSILYDSLITEPFFSSFRVLNNNTNNLFADKTEIFFTDIISIDSIKVNNVLCNLGKFKINESHLNNVYNVLNSDSVYFKDDSVRACLLSLLEHLEDSTKEEYVINYYNKYNDKPIIQLAALEVLSGINTHSSISDFKKLIVNNTPRSNEIDYSLFNTYFDTLQNYRYYFPEVLQLLLYPEYQRSIYLLSYNAINNKLVEPDIFIPYQKIIIDQANNYFAKRRMAIYSDSSWYYSGTSEYLITILSQLDNKVAIEDLLTPLLADDEISIKVKALSCLIKIGSDIPDDTIYSYLKNIKTRNMFYEELQLLNITKVAPAELVTQELFAEGDLYCFLVDDYQQPDSLILIDTRVSDEGQYYLYKFQISENRNEVWYSGISGPYATDNSANYFRGFKTKSNYMLFHKKSIEEHWIELLKD